MHAKGLRKGDVLCIFAPNLPEYAIALHGVPPLSSPFSPLSLAEPAALQAAIIGVVVTTCNPLYTARELAFQLKDANATYVLTIPLFLDKVSFLAPPLRPRGSRTRASSPRLFQVLSSR